MANDSSISTLAPVCHPRWGMIPTATRKSVTSIFVTSAVNQTERFSISGRFSAGPSRPQEDLVSVLHWWAITFLGVASFFDTLRPELCVPKDLAGLLIGKRIPIQLIVPSLQLDDAVVRIFSWRPREPSLPTPLLLTSMQGSSSTHSKPQEPSKSAIVHG